MSFLNYYPIGDISNNKINFITALTRPEYIEVVYKRLKEVMTVPWHWYATMDKSYLSVVPENLPSYPEVTFSLIDSNNPTGRQSLEKAWAISDLGRLSIDRDYGCISLNHSLSLINDGWIYCLDEDNMMHEDFPRVFELGLKCYPRAQGFTFIQLLNDNRIRLVPDSTYVNNRSMPLMDYACFIFKRSFIGGNRFHFQLVKDGIYPDQLFFYNVSAQSPEDIINLTVPCVYYNYLSGRRYRNTQSHKWGYKFGKQD